jgi:hypothetical protein
MTGLGEVKMKALSKFDSVVRSTLVIPIRDLVAVVYPKDL